MKILFVASRFPYPLIQGDRVRAYHQIRILSERHRVTLLAPIQTEREREGLNALRSFCERIEAIRVSQWRRVLSLLRGPFTSLPLQTLWFYDLRFRQKVQDLIHEEPFDLIHVQLVRTAPTAVDLNGIPRVIDFIDSLSLNWYRRSEREVSSVARIIRWEAGRIRAYEQALAEQYDRIVVSSPVDRGAIGPYDNVDVIPNGVNVEEFPFTEEGREQNTIVFTGRIGYFPNADAAMWFAAEVLPLVRQGIPEARFLIVGADPPYRVRQLRRLPGIEVTGYVARIQEYLARATLAVCPMRAGSGMQFKVLEAMASGAPVVATPEALGGIEAVDGEHLLVAEEADCLAEQVIRLLKDSALRHRLASNARHLVERHYTWDHSVAALETVYRKATNT